MENRRFSDEKLTELYDRVVRLEASFESIAAREESIYEALERNARSLEELTEHHSKYSAQMIDMLAIYSDVRGTVRVSAAMQKFGAWVIKWPIIGAGVYAIFKAIEKWTS